MVVRLRLALPQVATVGSHAKNMKLSKIGVKLNGKQILLLVMLVIVLAEMPQMPMIPNVL